jgi:hypothetical protein
VGEECGPGRGGGIVSSSAIPDCARLIYIDRASGLAGWQAGGSGLAVPVSVWPTRQSGSGRAGGLRVAEVDLGAVRHFRNEA